MSAAEGDAISVGEARLRGLIEIIEQDSSAGRPLEPHLSPALSDVRVQDLVIDGPHGPIPGHTYRGTADGVDVTSHGPFTCDGARFIDAVDALAGQEAGSNPLSCAVSDMLSLTATHAPSGPDDPPPTVVVVTNSGSAGIAACAQEESSFVDALALGIPVVAIGGREFSAVLAALSGGSFVVVTDPLQFRVVLGNLAPVAGRTLDSNHLRFVLTPEGVAATGPVFRPGRQTIWAYVFVRIGPHTSVEVPLVMPVQ